MWLILTINLIRAAPDQIPWSQLRIIRIRQNNQTERKIKSATAKPDTIKAFSIKCSRLSFQTYLFQSYFRQGLKALYI